jgi:hypothetical protein
MLLSLIIKKHLCAHQLEGLSALEMAQLIGGIAWLAERHGPDSLTTNQIQAELERITTHRAQKNTID